MLVVLGTQRPPNQLSLGTLFRRHLSQFRQNIYRRSPKQFRQAVLGNRVIGPTAIITSRPKQKANVLIDTDGVAKTATKKEEKSRDAQSVLPKRGNFL